MVGREGYTLQDKPRCEELAVDCLSAGVDGGGVDGSITLSLRDMLKDLSISCPWGF